MADATAEQLLSGFKREKKSAEVDGVGTVYFYDPPSVAERDAYYRHLRFEDGGVSITLEGIVDGIIARVKDANSRPLFKQIHRARILEEMSEERLMSIWRAIGGDKMRPAGDLSEAAEKK
jgi:hypothetical protein